MRLCDGYRPPQLHPHAIARRLKYPPLQRDSTEARHLNGCMNSRRSQRSLIEFIAINNWSIEQRFIADEFSIA
jgi:hypothetical protein